MTTVTVDSSVDRGTPKALATADTVLRATVGRSARFADIVPTVLSTA